MTPKPKPKPCTPKPVMASQIPKHYRSSWSVLSHLQISTKLTTTPRIINPTNFRPDYECLDFVGVTEGTEDGEVHQSFPNLHSPSSGQTEEYNAPGKT
jgi:hypothetical protein